jgi:hypothetical protein
MNALADTYELDTRMYGLTIIVLASFVTLQIVLAGIDDPHGRGIGVVGPKHEVSVLRKFLCNHHV